MSYPPGHYPGQPYDPNARQDAQEGGQQAPQRTDPTLLNPMGQQVPAYVPPSDPTLLNPVSQPDPGYVPPSDPTLLNPLSQPDPAYQQGQPYTPRAQPYPSIPQYQQAPPQYQQTPQYQQPYQQVPQQYPPQQGGFPPGPPGQGYPPQYGPNGSGSGGGGGKVLAAIGSILLTVLVIAGIIGLKVWKNNAKHHRNDANATDTTSLVISTSTSGAPTTRPSAKVPPAPTAPPTTAPTTKTVTTVWIAAAYNEASNEVHWATSSLGQDTAVGKAQAACGTSCQEPIWSKDACVAFAFGRGGGWASAWGTTINEAQDKAVAKAQGDWNVPGPFEFWSKCAKE